nr:MAG: hypothetical protein DIU61_03050 [Bacteroidota bacterium]
MKPKHENPAGLPGYLDLVGYPITGNPDNLASRLHHGDGLFGWSGYLLIDQEIAHLFVRLHANRHEAVALAPPSPKKRKRNLVEVYHRHRGMRSHISTCLPHLQGKGMSAKMCLTAAILDFCLILGFAGWNSDDKLVASDGNLVR